MIGCQYRFFRLQPRHAAHFQFLIEGHDGIATVTAVDPGAAIVRLSIPDGLAEAVDDALTAMRQDLPFPFLELEDPAEKRRGGP